MENSHDSGYRVNELRVDSTFSPVYTSSNIYSDGFKAITTYENASYHFEFTLILKELGRYILVVSDLYQEHLGTGNADLNAEANAITFEGKCPTFGYYICSMIEGDDYLELFEDELVYLDNEVYRGNLRSIEGSLGPLRSGSIGVEFSGYFGFEVVE
jgi:hypothetical protein